MSKDNRPLYRVERNRVNVIYVPLSDLQPSDALHIAQPDIGRVSYVETTEDGKIVVRQISEGFGQAHTHRFPVANLTPNEYGHIIDKTNNKARENRGSPILTPGKSFMGREKKE
ncbi:MAG: hypothetical protein KJ718_02705 [Nanoarchaeota archaeon]|nr:hypothetical protein [Nanoarchaeota archaeon]MBU1051440.1 hypothetical protein [Nanoarchaeota archaeon]